MGQKLSLWGSWVPIEHNVAWAEAYIYTKLHPCSRLATTDMAENWGLRPFGEGELGVPI